MKIANLPHLKDSINIYEVISNYVSLKKSGANYVGCCPFHSEKSASFTVSIQKGIYHCFGCNAGGDAIEFIQSYEKIDFINACEKIANIIGFTLEYAGGDYIKIDTSPLEKSKDFFVNALKTNTSARDYFLNRSLNEESIQKFELGFCPNSFEYINSIEPKDVDFCLSVGLVNKDRFNNLYATFSNRLIFPIHNHKGKIIAFASRVLDEKSTNQNAKYLNSKESKYYLKRQVLYGFHIARNHIISKREAIIVEGYMDVIALHQAGIKNAVATCGTALSNEQIANLTKIGAKIILCFDNDKAGINAILRGIEILINNGLYEAEVLSIQGGKDASDLLASNEIQKILEAKRVPIIEYALTSMLKHTDSIESKNSNIQQAKAFLSKINNAFIKEAYTKRAGEILGVNPDFIREQHKVIISHKSEFNITEASVIKAIMQEPRLIDLVIDWLDFEDFRTLKGCVENLAKDIIDSSARQISLDESIPMPNDFIACLKAIYEASSKNKIKDIKASNLPFVEKINKIQSIQDTLMRWALV